MVSILVPVYNVENYIERCAHSLFEQTYPEIEYIFIDDCSPDHSIDILLRVLDKYPNRRNQVRIIKHDKNRGLAAARNTAVDNCQSEFLIHVDSDDWVELDLVESLVVEQKKGNYDIVTANAMKHGKCRTIPLRKNEPAEKIQLISYYLKPDQSHVIWGRLIRTSLYREHNILAKEGINIGEDWQVIPKLFFYADSFSAIDNCLYHYNCMNDSSYMTSSEKGAKALKKGLQNAYSLNCLFDFFKDTQHDLFVIVSKLLSEYSYQAMNLCCANNNKKEFNKMKELLNKVDKKFYQNIGRKDILSIMIKNNYYCNKIYNNIFGK